MIALRDNASNNKVYPKARAGPKDSSSPFYEDELRAIWKLHHKEDNISEYPLYWERLNS